MNDITTQARRRLKSDAYLFRTRDRPTTPEWERIRQTLNEPGEVRVDAR